MEHTHVQHTEHRDDHADKMGMWLFLFTELLLFGGLFLVYSIYRYMNQEAFMAAGAHLDVFIGTLNTVILITSSLTVAISISAIQNGNKKLALNLLYFTIFCALLFLVNKYFEWSAKIGHDLYPGSDLFKTLPPGEGLFYLLYYFSTGLHAFHVIVGGILLAFVARAIQKDEVTKDRFVYLENAGLYWHLVDLIWIFLFPLYYLIT